MQLSNMPGSTSKTHKALVLKEHGNSILSLVKSVWKEWEWMYFQAFSEIIGKMGSSQVPDMFKNWLNPSLPPAVG